MGVFKSCFAVLGKQKTKKFFHAENPRHESRCLSDWGDCGAERVCGFFLQRFSALRVWCQGGTCGCKRHTCVGRRIGEVFIGLLLALLSCIIGLHICSPLALDGPGGVGIL